MRGFGYAGNDEVAGGGGVGRIGNEYGDSQVLLLGRAIMPTLLVEGVNPYR